MGRPSLKASDKRKEKAPPKKWTKKELKQANNLLCELENGEYWQELNKEARREAAAALYEKIGVIPFEQWMQEKIVWTSKEVTKANNLLWELENGGDWFQELNKELRWEASIVMSEKIGVIPFEQWLQEWKQHFDATVWDIWADRGNNLSASDYDYISVFVGVVYVSDESTDE